MSLPKFSAPSGVPTSTNEASSAWGVAALVLAVADTLSARFGEVRVRGELSAFSRAASGHCYFSLKDAQGAAALLRCAMFKRSASMLSFSPADGHQVEVVGRLNVYEPRGDLQLVVESMRRLGEGALYEEFLRLKAKLAERGWFDSQRKRSISAFPRRLGLVTSLGAAALHDVLTTLRRRAPHVEVVIYPSLVQGEQAPLALVQALGWANTRAEVDTLLLVRGGGSLEDLWAFNDERVVQAVVNSEVPVVCGVGHETDVTLCDLAADVRAATPTAAAELAVSPTADSLQALHAVQRTLSAAAQRRVDREGQRLDGVALRLGKPARMMTAQAERLDALAWRLRQGLSHAVGARRQALAPCAQRLQRATAVQQAAWAQRLNTLSDRLHAAQPQQVLQRGYAWLEDLDGRPLMHAADVKPGQHFRAVLQDGQVQARAQAPDPQRPSS